MQPYGDGEDSFPSIEPVSRILGRLRVKKGDGLLAALRSWTNAHVVLDEKSSTGWTLEVGSFPGWAKLKTSN